MTEIIWTGKSRSGDDWRVVGCFDDNGTPPSYVVERNQGDHDSRFFIIRVTFDKAEAIACAERHCC